MTHVVVDVSSWPILVVVLPRLQLCSLALQMDQHCKLSCQKCRNVTMEELLTDLDANPEDGTIALSEVIERASGYVGDTSVVRPTAVPTAVPTRSWRAAMC